MTQALLGLFQGNAVVFCDTRCYQVLTKSGSLPTTPHSGFISLLVLPGFVLEVRVVGKPEASEGLCFARPLTRELECSPGAISAPGLELCLVLD